MKKLHHIQQSSERARYSKKYFFPLLFFLFFILPLFLIPTLSHATVVNDTAYSTASGLTNTDLSNASSTNGLVGYWPFDGRYMLWSSATTSFAIDASGNDNNGALVGMNRTNAMVAGKSGQALSFNGSTQYVNGDNTTLIGTGATSVCAWIKQSSFVGTMNAIVANTQFSFYTRSTNKTLALTSNNGTTVVLSATQAIVNGVWQFVCGTRNASGQASIYINGALSLAANRTSGTPTVSTSVTCIGAKGNGISNFFAGSIDDVRIYNRVLSAGEITQLYHATGGDTVNKSNTGLTNTDLTSTTAGGNPSGLVGYWPFDGKYMTWSGATVGTSTDVSGTGSNGTLVNMNRATSVVAGKIGQAVSLNGTNSYINVGVSSTNVKTVAFWFKPNSTTQSILALNSSASITTSGGVLTTAGFTSPTLYVDGTITSTVVNTGWHLIVVTTTTPVNANAVTIGLVGSTYFSGVIDDVRIYNRVLSAGEITQLYHATGGDTVNKSNTGLTNTDLTSTTAGGNPSGLVGYWPFDGKYMTWSGATVGTSTDVSGTGSNGTLVNMNRATSVVAGKIGQAVSLNGTNSYINVGVSSTNVKTVAFWFKPNSTTQSILALNSSASITTSGGVLTTAGFTSPTLYVDGTITSTVVNTGWHLIVVTTTTPVNANAVTIGLVGSTYFSGVIDDVRIYNRVLSAGEVLQLYNIGSSPSGSNSLKCGAYSVTDPATTTLYYGTVLAADGNCWLDRNLGATEVANSSADYNAYGSLFQWGRGADGHQLVIWTASDSGTLVYPATTTLSSTDNPGFNDFIIGSNDWRSPDNNNLWQGVNGVNNPCPVGFAVPTRVQWQALLIAEGITSPATGYNSSLKLTTTGYITTPNGVFNPPAPNLYYWSRTIAINAALVYVVDNGSLLALYRGSGFPVRCIQN